jgi:hypothetical protein
MRILSLFLVVLSLASCASARLPTCDGKHRRPLNVPAQASVAYPSCGSAAQGDHHAA